MNQRKDIEQQIWDYLDGLCTSEDSVRIAKLIEVDPEWTMVFDEVVELQDTLKDNLELEHPSMRFTKNVMEAVLATNAVKLSNKYINPSVIRGIAAVFIVAILGSLVFSAATVHWGGASRYKLPTYKMPEFSLSGIFTGPVVNVILGLQVVLALVVTDMILKKRRQNNISGRLK